MESLIIKRILEICDREDIDPRALLDDAGFAYDNDAENDSDALYSLVDVDLLTFFEQVLST